MSEQKNPYFVKKVKQIEVSNPKKISQLLAEMSETGFQGKKLGETVNVWEDMIRDKNLTIVMGFAGSLSTTGQWKIIKWLMENHFIDVLVSTGANISEDILDGMGHGYWQGHHMADDKDLLKYKIDRFYDVFADEMQYRQLESLIAEFMQTLSYEQKFSSREFLHLFGKWRNIRS